MLDDRETKVETLQWVLAALPIPTVLIDATDAVRAVNHAYAVLWNEAPEPLIGRSLFDVHGGCLDLPAIRRGLVELEARWAEPQQIPLDISIPQQERRHLSCLLRPIDDRDLPGWRLLTFEQRTEVRRLEESLVRAEARIQTLLASAVDAIVIINRGGAIKAFNPAAERLFGYSAEEVLGENVRILMPLPYKDEHDSYLQRYLSTGQKRVIGIGREVTGLRRDGTTFPMELSISEIFDGEEPLFVGTVRDITKSRRAEEALRDSEARSRAILSTAVDAIITIDEAGAIKSLNPAAQKLFGYSYHEMIGENVRMLMPSPFHDEHDKYLSSYLLTGVRKVIGIGREVVGRRKDGTTFPLELSVSEFQQGRRRYFTGIVRDVTDRKRYENRLRSSIREAEDSQTLLRIQANELAQQAEQLRLAQQAADAANEAKSEFLANMSHEIRAPLTAILGFAEQLEDSVQDVQQAADAATIRRNGEHLLAVINDILDLSRIEAGEFPIESLSTSPFQIADDVVSLMRVRATAKGLLLTLKCLEPIPAEITTDPTRLRQILMNLVSNAIKFTDRGGVTITLAFSPNSADSRLMFQITDTGIGIPLHLQQRLFKPFSQADSSVTRRYGGSGLGLALSRRLTEFLGGRISFESREHFGSKFLLELPVQPTELQTLVLPEESLYAGPSGTPPDDPASVPLIARVLVVEDGADNRKYLGVCLLRAGADVEFAESGADAVRLSLEALKARPFDVVLMDMQMPDIDGYSATRTLRERGYSRPIIALTAHAMSGDRERCLEAGCSDYATKPIKQRQLVELVRRAVERTSSIRDVPAVAPASGFA